MTNRSRIFIILLLLQPGMLTTLYAAPKPQQLRIAYLTQQQKAPAALSNLDAFTPDKGEPGAELAITDNNTTGKFTDQTFILDKFVVPLDGDTVKVYNSKIAEKYAFVLLNLPAEQLLAIADLKTSQAHLFLDIASSDDVLRNEQCRANILHLQPSRAMRADALAQFMLKKRWVKWFLVVGETPGDILYAAAIKRAAKRFGMQLVAEKRWTHTYDARKTEQADVPVFTQGEEYDVLVAADEQGLFGEYLGYRTWSPRPVIGTQGLIATAWHKTHEQWGAIQMQNRFKEKNARWMDEQDYSAYLAVRAIGEAATRTRSNELTAIKTYLLSEQFALQGYKGNSLSFRPWDGQLRQPILLAADRSLVAVAPIEGFLHPKTELDTLGYDQPETKCQGGLH
ncbi:MAG: ABC transporter substrate-binding protein [Methylococcaceae bacterium]|nr:ABC transporter substrate-binding protein [Methylococcaceae bacterium]